MASQTQHPDAVVGARDNWALGLGATKVAAVAANDGDATYIEATATEGNVQQSFTFPAFDLPAGATVESLLWSGIIREAVGGANFRPLIRVGGTEFNLSQQLVVGQTINATSGYFAYEFCTSINPSTSSPWTIADVEGTSGDPLQEMSIFAASVAGPDELRCTEILLTVIYDLNRLLTHPGTSGGARG